MNAKKIIYLILFLLWAASTFASTQKRSKKTEKQNNVTAVNAKTQFIQAGNNKIAYRTIGSGSPLILCNRLRGILDTWDPLFLDNLAKTNKVIIFDYPGIGLSSGRLAPTMLGVATDVKQFAAALKLSKFRLLGWSYGGAVAQSFAAHFPEMVSHLILIGANPPGKNDTPYEQAFLDAAFKPVNDLQDEEILFFEPSSAKSRAAAKASNLRIAARKTDRSIMVTPEKFGDYFKGVADYQKDEFNSREKLAGTKVPILVIMGDHDPSCPVENWFPLSKKWKTMQLIVIPSSGHGVQHEFPKYIASQIELFVTAT
ncbi:alpha/beta fold hydrolase [Pedobacter frigiditerrae]|uniref:Alpha/beta fold hydrolase n=1 Tax=Pedobacter frigiditerrae TaxID=2530452 RepID=A0A4R0MNW3_9SPHI|nr:alpha/beta hydrolase [Pedobacter frigiditerrae]TCC88511.1 alpha/beta fold hydrolase [Pedobacter frigiditerrae]